MKWKEEMHFFYFFFISFQTGAVCVNVQKWHTFLASTVNVILMEKQILT